MQDFIDMMHHVPNEIFKNKYYLTHTISNELSLLQIHYKKGPKATYSINVSDWRMCGDVIHIGIHEGGYPIPKDDYPKHLLKVVNNFTNYLTILGFPVRIIN